MSTDPKKLAAVPRGHEDRCSRCGWRYGAVDGRKDSGCTPDYCCALPLPDYRRTCAGCGAFYDDEKK